MRTRILAGLLSLCLLAGWLPTAALADEAEGVPPSGVTCNQEETCQAAEHLEGCPRSLPKRCPMMRSVRSSRSHCQKKTRSPRLEASITPRFKMRLTMRRTASA